MGLFGKSTFLGKDLEAWSLETWAWFMRNRGGMAGLRTTPLVLPNRDFYPPTEMEGWERGDFVFQTTKRLMRMGNWPCRLESFDRSPSNPRLGDLVVLKTGAKPSATFRIEGGQATIAYARDLLERPRDLVAAFAHELSHYQIATIREPIPGGREVHELATELGVAYNGFAVFAANSAFDLAQYQDVVSQGWRMHRQGYFSERSWAFALAVFLTLKGEAPPEGVLKSSVAGLTKSALRYLKRRPELLQPLSQIG